MIAIIFINSFMAHLLLSLRSEYAEQAAILFGFPVFTASAFAFAGSFLALLCDYGFGYFLSHWRANWHNYQEDTYKRFSRIAAREGLVLLLAWPMPFIGLIAAAAGVMRVPPARALAVLALGRLAFYLYASQQTG